MDLINQLMEKLGVSSDQAKGGVGLLLKFVKEKLASSDYAKIAEYIPEADSFIGDAPDTSGGLMGAIGGLASSLGGGAGNLGSLAGILQGFKDMNMDGDMVQKFGSVVTSFVQEKGGDSISGLLEGALKSE